METPSRLRIGEWAADRTTNELRREHRKVRVEPKAMEVLMVLGARAGEVVSREDLLAAVWPGVVVGDEALTQTIIKLRRALGDQPRAPSYIETISKRGYRLIAAVAAGDATPPARPRGWRVPVAAAIALVLLAGGALIVNFAGYAPAKGPAAVELFDSADGHRTGALTVSVVEFDTVGAGAEQTYLARGISSDLMTDLSRLPGLRLIAVSKGPGAAASARARYVVTGSVQREGGMLRVNVRLVDSHSQEQVWSQRFERPFGDLLDIQNAISRSLTEQLPARITEAERRRLAKRYTANPEAYEQFLRGQALLLVRRSDENRQARVFYGKALELDPAFARAYAGLAMTYAMDYRYQASANSPGALERAIQLAESARLIDPAIPEVYWTLGFVQTQSRRYEEAIRSLRTAIELNPSYADAYALMGGIYTYLGTSQKSIPLLRTALRLNPDGGYLYFLLLGRAYLFQGDLEQALINLREAHGRNPADIETRVYLTAALAAAGDGGAAQWEAEEIRMQESEFSVRRWLATYPLTSPAYRARLLELLAQVGLE